jgi:hypothetical protein
MAVGVDEVAGPYQVTDLSRLPVEGIGRGCRVRPTGMGLAVRVGKRWWVAGLAVVLGAAALATVNLHPRHQPPAQRPPVPDERLVVAPRPGLAWQVDQTYGTDDTIEVAGAYLVEVPRDPTVDTPVPPPAATLVVRDAATGRRLWATQDPVGLVYATRAAVYSVDTAGPPLPNPGAAQVTAYDLPTGRSLRLPAGLPTTNGVDPTGQYALGYAQQNGHTVLVAYDPSTGHQQWTANLGGYACPSDAILSTLLDDGPRIVVRLGCDFHASAADILCAIDAATGAVLWTDDKAVPDHAPPDSPLEHAGGPTLVFDQTVARSGPLLASATTGRLLPSIPYPYYDASQPALAPDGSIVIPQPVTGDLGAPVTAMLICWDPATNMTRWTIALPTVTRPIAVAAFYESSVLLSVDGYLRAFNMADGHPMTIGDAANIPLSTIGISYLGTIEYRPHNIAQYANLLIGPTGAIQL